jgi:hypothetical protein
VVTADDCDTTVGQTHWDVYAGATSGFAAAPTSFSVPAPRCQVDFDQVAAAKSIAYAMIDLTGDGHADLVVVADDCDTTVGQTHWDVYAWSPSGFAAAPASFGVPAPRCLAHFDQTAGATSITYATMDLTGDAHPDLVVTADDCDTTVGQTHWDVYGWSASGFSAAPKTFGVPAPRCQISFAEVSASTSVRYSTWDLTGDGHPDLVVTADDCDTTVGQTHWDVYGWSASGFSAAPKTFGVPAPRCQVSFDEVGAAASISYFAMALSGDGHPDLVVTADDCDATVGQTHWDVYAWSPSGFATAPTSFAVPAPRCRASFDAPASVSAISYTTMDLTNGCQPSLVVYADDCDATVGQTHWDTYGQQ